MSSNPSSANTEYNLSLLNEATRALKNGDQEQAIAHLKAILDNDPAHELANGMLASIHAELGLVEQALSGFQRVLQQNPQNVLARFQMGVLLLASERNQEAFDTLQPMLDQRDAFLAYFHCGLALVNLGDAARARPLLLQARKHMPSTHPLYENLQQLLTATG